jgi:hypothetical protein
VVVIPLEKMAEEGWTEACLRKAGARFYKKTMSWRVPEEAWPPERKEKMIDKVEDKDKVDVEDVEDVEVENVEVVEMEEEVKEVEVVDASTQCEDSRPRFEYGVGPEEKVVERMMRYLRR